MRFLLALLTLCSTALGQGFLSYQVPDLSGLPSGFTPANLPALKFWFEAQTGMLKGNSSSLATNDGDEVYIWLDQSGLKNNVTNSSLTTFGTNRASGPNGSNFLSIYDGNGYVSYTNGINVASATNWTMFFVVRRGGNVNAGGFWWDSRNPDQTPGSSINQYIRFAGGGASSTVSGNSFTAANSGSSVFLNNSPWYYFTWTPSTIRTNGVEYHAANIGTLTVTNGFGIGDVNDHLTVPARYYFDMVEAFGVATDLTGTANLTNAEVYLKTKYGL